MLANLADRFHLLKFGLAFVLSFIGVKMLLPLAADGLMKILGETNTSSFAVFLQKYLNHDYKQTEIYISLAVVSGAIAVSIILSLIIPPKKDAMKEMEEDLT
jgi:predicted tellurium resistance membrane protein TerC